MSLSGMYPAVQDAMDDLRRLAQAYGVQYRVTSTYRSTVEQRRLYAAWIGRGRTGLPAAAPGTSTHEYGVAFDAVSPDLEDLVYLAEQVGFVWAGPRDPVHFDVFGVDAWRRLLSEAGLRGTGA